MPLPPQRTIAFALATALAALSTSSPSAAQPRPGAAAADPRVAELKQRGNDAMAAFDPSEALKAYRQAYELSNEPALLYNMGRALDAMGDFPAALSQFEEFARIAPADLKARVPKLAELIAETRAKVTVVSITCNVPGARVFVGNRGVGEIPASGALKVTLPAGAMPVEVSAEGYAPFKKQENLPGGGTASIDVTLIAKNGVGVLVIDTSPAGSDVIVDDKALGKAPVEASVSPGTHTISARHAGFDDTSTTTVVVGGEHRQLTLHLDAVSPAITSRWWFWTGIGVAVVGGVVITYAALSERSPDTGTIQPGKTQAPLLKF